MWARLSWDGARREKEGAGYVFVLSAGTKRELSYREETGACRSRVRFVKRRRARRRDNGSRARIAWGVAPAPPHIAVCETCAESGSVPSLGLWAPDAAVQARRHICIAVDAAKHRDAVVEEFKNRRDASFARKDIRRMKEHLPRAITSGLGNVLE